MLIVSGVALWLKNHKKCRGIVHSLVSMVALALWSVGVARNSFNDGPGVMVGNTFFSVAPGKEKDVVYEAKSEQTFITS